MISVYLLSGISLFLIGFIYGLIEWIKFASMSISAPTGTVILPTMCIILGIQFLKRIDVRRIIIFPKNTIGFWRGVVDEVRTLQMRI